MKEIYGEITAEPLDGPEFARRLGRYAEDCLDQIVLRGFYRPELQRAAIVVEDRWGSLAAERLLENCQKYLGDPNFNLGQYLNLTIQGYQHFGLRAGSQFSRSYGEMYRLGVDPNDYFHWVEEAVVCGKRVFGSWFAYGLPSVIAKEGKAEEFKDQAISVRENGNLEVAKSFILHTGDALEVGITIERFGELANKSIVTLGKKCAPWLIRNMPGLSDLGYSPEQFLHDTETLAEQRGERAARWYASGFTQLLEIKKSVKREIKETEEKARQYPGLRRKIWGLKEIDKKLDPLVFAENYLQLLYSYGQALATFYSVAAGRWGPFSPQWVNLDEGLLDQIDYFHQVPDKIIGLYYTVSKTVFHKAAWFIPNKTAIDPKSLVHLLDSIISFYETHEERATIQAIAYTHGVAKRGSHPDILASPPEKEKNDPLPDYEIFDNDDSYFSFNEPPNF